MSNGIHFKFYLTKEIATTAYICKVVLIINSQSSFKIRKVYDAVPVSNVAHLSISTALELILQYMY